MRDARISEGNATLENRLLLKSAFYAVTLVGIKWAQALPITTVVMPFPSSRVSGSSGRNLEHDYALTFMHEFVNFLKSETIIAMVSYFFIQTLQLCWPGTKCGPNYFPRIINTKN